MSSDILLAFGKAIRKIRQEKSISQEELADMCGLHRTYISDVELGKRNISLENIYRITSALEVTLAQLFQLINENTISAS